MSTTTSTDLSLSGVGSGIDWQSMLTQLTAVENQSLDPLNTEKTTYNSKLAAWQTFGSTISALNSASAALQSASGFDLTSASLSSSSSTAAASLLSATTDSTATKGSYQIVVTNQAQVEKLASNSFSSESNALGITGTIIVNGQAVQLQSTDTLQNLSSKINLLDNGSSATGVTASIMQDSSSTYRLVLTSDTAGSAGISLLNGSASDTLGTLGFNGTGTVLKNSVAGGAQSDSFTSASTSVEALLGTDGNDLSGTVTINGKQASIDLSDNLNTIASTLSSAGISAKVVSQTSGSTTTNRLQIEGMSSWTDSNNVLQALGVVQGNRTDQIGVTGSIANTTDGSTPITAATKITDIYGYNTNAAGDKITISGTLHDGTAATSTDFAITSSTTVGDLLNQIQSTFGNVTASLTSEGKIQVVDHDTGTSQLSLNLKSTLTDPGGNAGVLGFGSFGQVGAVKKYVLQQGENAAFSVDGMSMTSPTNTVTGAIPGVTLNLLGQDSGTTVTLNVNRDTQGIESKINTFISAYNASISYVDTQMTYNSDTQTTGGPLFGDNTLKGIKLQLQDSILNQVGTGSIKYLSDAGITVGDDNMLHLNTSTFENALATNYTGVVSLFSDSGSSTNAAFQYAGATTTTQSGTYAMSVSQLSGTNQTLAGTINNQTASGNGNYLTLNDTGDPANGLSVLFTGSTVPSSSTFTFTRGIASLLANYTNQLSDSVTGTVTLQETATQSSIDALTTKITDMQNNINQKMDTMKTEFEDMNTAVAQMQQTQSYLSSQLANL